MVEPTVKVVTSYRSPRATVLTGASDGWSADGRRNTFLGYRLRFGRLVRNGPLFGSASGSLISGWLIIPLAVNPEAQNGLNCRSGDVFLRPFRPRARLDQEIAFRDD